ncbi:serine/arginine repetitive matrix protein 1 [Melanotaenia boesemani]|uniref:serine/arginine repetitive matrix protein 1 n=1 Tax=Melanotaenia boesemani TaxID=1250792 RepID=UPI001C053C73|nr:serine/arginine repetitive matrix protein 1 [Melanotaenia boesemani]
MEKFFKPVHSPSPMDEIKPQKNHHHHHFYHHQDMHSHRYTKLDDTDIYTDDSQGHRHHRQHSQYLRDSSHRSAHYPHQFHHDEENETIFNHHTPVTLSRASSSSLSSSSSTSSYSSWYTETSANDPFSLRHAERPQHSLSCSNIPDVRRGFREDDSSEPVVFATIKHNKKGNVSSRLNNSSEQHGSTNFSSLNRGHSRSDEGLLQCNESDVGGKQSKVSHINYGPLYKSASLNRNLAFSEDDIVLGVPKGPKRAVSSCQLPSKGILKNKEHHNDIRKAKSMEVLSPRVTKGEGQSGQKGKGITQAEIEQARANFVEGKLQFSAFLDEITKQVMRPSDLTILGVQNNKTPEKTSTPAPTSDPVKPQLPPKKHKTSPAAEMAQTLKQPSRQVKACSSSRKRSDCSNPDKPILYTARNHDGSPPPYHHLNSGGHSRKDRRPSPSGGSTSWDRYNRYGPHLTDGTSTSPEPTHPKQRHHRKHQPSTFHNQQPHSQHFHQQIHEEFENRRPSSSPLSSAQGAAGPGFGSESSSTKSDSSRARDTASTATSHSSEQSSQHQSQHTGMSKQHRDMLFDSDHFQALQEENADLHQNLLQTVVCIESLEAELQRTRDELSQVKENFLQTHTGTKQANNLLGERLHIASENLSSERKYLLNRVSQLGSELDDAHKTIAALENINVPCLIKDLLEKQFGSAEAIQKFLTTSSPINLSHQADGQSHPPKEAEAAHDWLTRSDAGSQRVTAFLPFKHGVPAKKNEGSLSGQHESSPSFSVADISAAIYKKMAASYPARPLPVYPQSQKQSSKGTNHADAPHPDLHSHVGGDSWAGRGGLKVLLLEQDTGDVNSVSAQQILDGFMQHLQGHKEAGGGTEQQSGNEWASGVEQTGKVAD